MTKALEDHDQVLRVFEGRRKFRQTSVRDISEALGWHLANGKPNTARVHRALMLLAAEKLIWQEPGSKRWRIVTKRS